MISKGGSQLKRTKPLPFLPEILTKLQGFLIWNKGHTLQCDAGALADLRQSLWQTRIKGAKDICGASKGIKEVRESLVSTFVKPQWATPLPSSIKGNNEAKEN